MANTKCTYELQWNICITLVLISFVGAVALFITGGMMYHKNQITKSTHEQNTCKVLASNYYESKCAGHRGSTNVCFIPVWLVAYSVFQGVTELRVEARIEEGGRRTTTDAENQLNQYQIGWSYMCWCNVIDPLEARWDEPNTFNGMMLLIFGGASAILCIVAIFFSYRAQYFTQYVNAGVNDR